MTTNLLKKENSYQSSVAKLLISLGIKECAFETKICKTATFSHNQIRLGQKAILNNPNPVYHRSSDMAMDTGSARGVDGYINTAKYLCIVHLHDNKPHCICIFMNSQSRYLLTESAKLQSLIDEYGTHAL